MTKKYTRDDMYEALEFGCWLSQTAGYEEGHDAWIENHMEKFIQGVDKKHKQAHWFHRITKWLKQYSLTL